MSMSNHRNFLYFLLFGTYAPSFFSELFRVCIYVVCYRSLSFGITASYMI
jgi:hypothetical protein